MITFLFTLLTSSLLLHPGHSTRVEVQWNEDSEQIELAIRIDHADLEAALRKRLGRVVRVEALTDEQAEQWIAPYLGDTLRIDGSKLSAHQLTWVGWERKRVSSWIYIELKPDRPVAAKVSLQIQTLLEVEPELNHVVTLRRGDQQESRVLTKEKPVIVIPTEPVAP